MNTVLSLSGSAQIRPGDLVTVAVAQPKGEPVEPPKQYVAVQVKPWHLSPTMWIALTGLVGGITDAVIETAIPMLLDSKPFDPRAAWRPLLVAALSAVIAWRRKQQNTVIGSAVP